MSTQKQPSPTSTSSSDTGSVAPDSHINSTDSISYWNNISPDVNGMLGGYPQVSRIDLQGSRNFITKVRRQLSKPTSTPNQQQPPSKKLKLAVDCGAGIGRITTGLLTQIADTVDIVEPIAKFADVLSSPSHPLQTAHALGDIYIAGLESWTPTKTYDLIWNQWCVGHLTDTQLTSYLQRAAAALTDQGWMCVKENLSTDPFGADLFDDVDSSVTRSDAKFRSVFEDAGLVVLRAEVQTGFPKGLGLYPVKMYALRPR